MKGIKRSSKVSTKRKSSGRESSTSCTLQLLVLTLIVVSVLSVIIVALTNVDVQDRVRHNMKFVGEVWSATDRGGSSAPPGLRADQHIAPPLTTTPALAIVKTPVISSVVATPVSPPSSSSVPAVEIATDPPIKRFPNIHFIHIPKCGGTTMTVVLRQMQCTIDPVANADCCLNPGFCDFHAKRRCATIHGCTNHFPNRPKIFKPMPSITVMREPLSRILSAFFYRGHSPNLDFFQVRPEAKEIKEGKRPRVEFPEYIGMHEYQNIQTRMLGADSFPYRNITVTDEIFDKAVEALNGIFVVGIQEEFEISAKLVLREMQVQMNFTLVKERDMSTAQTAIEKAKLKSDKNIMNKLAEANTYDIALYKLGVKKFCEKLRKYQDLWDQVQKNGKVSCT